MSGLATAMRNASNVTTTDNGAVAYRSSLNPLVDWVAGCGGLRGKPKDAVDLFRVAFAADARRALSLLLYTRDVREGVGERQTTRDVLVWLEQHHFAALACVLPHLHRLGRWDDLLCLRTPQGREMALVLIGDALRAEDALCAKWMPRMDALHPSWEAEFEAADYSRAEATLTPAKFRRLVWSRLIAGHMGLTPKQYRKTLVGLTSVVETAMCAKDLSGVDFSKLPSLASSRYMTAFHRLAPEAYAAYKAALTKPLKEGEKPEAKINAAAVTPYDVLLAAKRGDEAIAQAQWQSLPNWFVADTRLIPMVDVSGSMEGYYIDQARTKTCMDMAIAMGMYMADKQPGAMNGLALTFTDRPEVVDLAVLGEAGARPLVAMERAFKRRVGYNTDVAAAFRALLGLMVKHNVPEGEAPTHIVLLTDSQFDAVATAPDRTVLSAMRQEYAAAGYFLPTVVFWNLNFAKGAIQAKAHTSGAVMVSGYGPAPLAQVFKAQTPAQAMLAIADNPRYAIAGME